MKKILTNVEIEKYINTISGKDSFRNNAELKIPGSLDWSLRVNIKALTDVYSLYNEARNELVQKYISAGKVENDRIKPEFVSEYNKDLVELMSQKNDIEFRKLNVKDFITLPLSMPEKDVLFAMCDEKEVDEYFNEQENNDK